MLIRIWGERIPGVGFGAIIVIIYLVGLIASNFLGKKLILYIEHYVVNKIPVVGFLYQGTKQVLESFSAPSKNGFMQVVLLEYPRKGIQTIGFITNETTNATGEKIYNVFVPQSPTPTTGFLQIVKEEDITRTNMSVEDGIKMVVSAGKYSPKTSPGTKPK